MTDIIISISVLQCGYCKHGPILHWLQYQY